MTKVLYSGNKKNQRIYHLVSRKEKDESFTIDVYFEESEKYYYEKFMNEMENISVELYDEGWRVEMPLGFWIVNLCNLKSTEQGLSDSLERLFFPTKDNYVTQLRIISDTK